MKFIGLNDTKRLEDLAAEQNGYVLKALPESSWAMIMGDQDIGKSKLMFSIAYSLATNIDFVGLLPCNERDRRPRNVAIWASEESLNWASRKVLAHMNAFSPSVVDVIKSRVSLIDDINPENDKEYLFDDELKVNRSFVDNLVEQLKDVDVLIIDTLRDAMGIADEVEQDNKVKVLLSKIVRDSSCAIIYLHHPRKSDVGASARQLSTVSGSGLSKTNAKARVHYSLTRQGDGVSLSFGVKANNIPKDKRNPINLGWFELGEHSLYVMEEKKDEIIELITSGNLPPSAEDKIEPNEMEDKSPKIKKNQNSKLEVDIPKQIVHKIMPAKTNQSNVNSRVRGLRAKAEKIK
ncbi:AAA family ATPase [Vibrio hepatarius]|uniref:AAA family ATPase n=1 Tax=Vibrio hepatarius TaxID=171383 RepID=UPI001C094F28|nr:AAA family ATPase [Vibrio hepatarius]MBU2896113.1 helicase RepA family protein [Vibrio hepatarius]